jgi:hypothetical protein
MQFFYPSHLSLLQRKETTAARYQGATIDEDFYMWVHANHIRDEHGFLVDGSLLTHLFPTLSN